VFKPDEEAFDPADIPCCACNQRDHSVQNPIMLCDGCDVALHLGRKRLSAYSSKKNAKG
jgi:hypothetical protein